MRVLLDECVPRKLKQDLEGHEDEFSIVGSRGPNLRSPKDKYDVPGISPEFLGKMRKFHHLLNVLRARIGRST